MITWEQLTEEQRYAFKEYGNGKRCYEFTSEAIGSLAYAGYFVLVQDDYSDSAWYAITDKGRRVLAEAGQPTTDSKPETITAKQFVDGNYAAKIAAGECVVTYTLSDKVIKIKNAPASLSNLQRNITHRLVFMTPDDSDIDDYFDTTAYASLTVRWLPQQPTTASADAGGEHAELVQMSHNLEHVATQWVQLHQALSAALGLEFEPDEDVDRYTEELTRLRSELAAARGDITRLREALESINSVVLDAPIKTGDKDELLGIVDSALSFVDTNKDAQS